MSGANAAATGSAAGVNSEEAPASVLLHRDGRLGHIVLNRPRALNALTHDMVNVIGATLAEWAMDATVQVVLISGSGDRGLCAGGDIVAIYRDAETGGRATEAFWADEYPVNALIARYPKPVIAVMDGVVLGGGVGISAHARIRLVTERTKIGMPEAAIGFVPDVGGTFLFSRAPGELGTHLALTSDTMTGADAMALGLADRYLPSSAIATLVRRLATDHVQQVLAEVTEPAPPAPLLQQRAWIDRCYAGDRVEVVLDRLDAAAEPGAADAARRIRANSPTAVKVALASVRRARSLPDLEAALRQEYRVSLHSLARPDFREGIRAMVIDKDRAPRWTPATLAEVSDAEVDSHFGDLGPRELQLEHTPQSAPPTQEEHS